MHVVFRQKTLLWNLGHWDNCEAWASGHCVSFSYKWSWIAWFVFSKYIFVYAMCLLFIYVTMNVEHIEICSLELKRKCVSLNHKKKYNSWIKKKGRKGFQCKLVQYLLLAYGEEMIKLICFVLWRLRIGPVRWRYQGRGLGIQVGPC